MWMSRPPPWLNDEVRAELGALSSARAPARAPPARAPARAPPARRRRGGGGVERVGGVGGNSSAAGGAVRRVAAARAGRATPPPAPKLPPTELRSRADAARARGQLHLLGLSHHRAQAAKLIDRL